MNNDDDFATDCVHSVLEFKSYKARLIAENLQLTQQEYLTYITPRVSLTYQFYNQETEKDTLTSVLGCSYELLLV
jgi:hypothetical protein